MPDLCQHKSSSKPADGANKLADHHRLWNLLPEFESAPVVAFLGGAQRQSGRHEIIRPAVKLVEDFPLKSHVVFFLCRLTTMHLSPEGAHGETGSSSREPQVSGERRRGLRLLRTE